MPQSAVGSLRRVRGSSQQIEMKSHLSVAAWRAIVRVPVFQLLSASVTYAVPLATDKGNWRHTSHHAAEEEEGAGAGLYLVIAAVLVLLGGAFAGLTIALMGQDEIYLQVLSVSGEGAERANAQKVLNLLKKGKHWVLVTLLLGNVITNETLPIMLDRSLGGGWQAVLGSTVLIVIFGEITPQSICVRYGLPIGAFMAPFVLVMMWVLAPVAWPTAKLLDYLLGEDHGTTYKKAGLKTLVTLHRTLGSSPDDRLSKDEVTIISAARTICMSRALLILPGPRPQSQASWQHYDAHGGCFYIVCRNYSR
jgi:metal transporter CNNM